MGMGTLNSCRTKMKASGHVHGQGHLQALAGRDLESILAAQRV